MSSLHSFSLVDTDATPSDLAEPRILGSDASSGENALDSELLLDGDDIEILADGWHGVTAPPPPRVRTKSGYAPILPPPRRPIATG